MERKEARESGERWRRGRSQETWSDVWWDCCWGSHGVKSRVTVPGASSHSAPESHAKHTETEERFSLS